MKLDRLKEEKELASIVLLAVSAISVFVILIKVKGFFAAPAKAASVVKEMSDTERARFKAEMMEKINRG